MLLTSAGVALAIAAAGLALAPRVAAVVVAWLLIAGIAAAAVWLVRRAGRRATPAAVGRLVETAAGDRKSTRLNSRHRTISYAVFCLKKKKDNNILTVLCSEH